MYKSPNALKELWIFFKRHIVILILCLFSGFIMAKHSNIPVPSWCPDFVAEILLRPQEETTAFEFWGILNNLSLAFIASIITYLFIQYLPERRKAYKAYAILKGTLRRIYEDMSYLISIYLFELGIEKDERQISFKSLSNLPHVSISDRKNSCRVEAVFDGKKGNVNSYGYSLLSDSIHYIDAIKSNLDQVKGAMCSAQLDAEIIDIISTIENGMFVRWFHNSSIVKMRDKNPGIQHNIVNLDKGLFEFIKCHLLLNKYSFEKTTFQITKISDDEMKIEEENMLFLNNRNIFRMLGINRVNYVVNSILSLEPTEDHLKKSQGVLLELLMYYDMVPLKSQEVLSAALMLAKYIIEHESDPQRSQYALLNGLQIKKRLNCLSDEDVRVMQNIISNEQAPKEIVLGAAIILGDYEKALCFFDQLSNESKESFIRLPIYHLWSKPPIEANPNPSFFNIF